MKIEILYITEGKSQFIVLEGDERDILNFNAAVSRLSKEHNLKCIRNDRI